jgi:tripartite-type tricarboxylate transporter receptor subunit TctC
LEAATQETLRDPTVLARLSDDGAIPSRKGAREFGEFMSRERERWGQIVSSANITLE